MTKEELEERIDKYIQGCDYSNNRADVWENPNRELKQLIRDVIAEVTPEAPVVYESEYDKGFDEAINAINQKTKDLFE